MEPGEASVWAQCLPPTQGKEAFPEKGGGGTRLKGHRAGKGATHPSRAKGTEKGGSHRRDDFGGPVKDGEQEPCPGIPQPGQPVSPQQTCCGIKRQKRPPSWANWGSRYTGPHFTVPSVPSPVPNLHCSPSKTQGSFHPHPSAPHHSLILRPQLAGRQGLILTPEIRYPRMLGAVSFVSAAENGPS